MGVSNFDAIAANSLSVGGASLASFVGRGTTPATGWTNTPNFSFKDVTVAGAALNDVVVVTLNAVAFIGTPAELYYVQGYVTGANTVRIYYGVLSFSGAGSVGSTTVNGIVSYVVIRPS
jgi:hypothetical protein